jgi:sugar phosphate isomerase/epimerase
MTNAISFITANYVAREVGFAMHGWGHGDRATNEAFAPIETFPDRFDELLATISALGFQTVDVWGGHLNPQWATDEHLDVAVDALRRHRLQVGSYQVYAPPVHLERACAIAERLGTGILSGFAPLDDPRLPSLLERHGLVFAWENHPEPTPQAVLEKIGGLGRVGVCVDTGWFGTQGYDAANAIEQLGERVLHVHLKDVLHEGEPHETCRWGEGVVEVEACVRTLQRLGYEGTMVVEHEPETFDPTDDIRAMRSQLEGWLA